jgi:hypothetical protein
MRVDGGPFFRIVGLWDCILVSAWFFIINRATLFRRGFLGLAKPKDESIALSAFGVRFEINKSPN